MFDNKSVLITGGTGSFGRKFTRTLIEKHLSRDLSAPIAPAAPAVQ